MEDRTGKTLEHQQTTVSPVAFSTLNGLCANKLNSNLIANISN